MARSDFSDSVSVFLLWSSTGLQRGIFSRAVMLRVRAYPRGRDVRVLDNASWYAVLSPGRGTFSLSEGLFVLKVLRVASG